MDTSCSRFPEQTCLLMGPRCHSIYQSCSSRRSSAIPGYVSDHRAHLYLTCRSQRRPQNGFSLHILRPTPLLQLRRIPRGHNTRSNWVPCDLRCRVASWPRHSSLVNRLETDRPIVLRASTTGYPPTKAQTTATDIGPPAPTKAQTLTADTKYAPGEGRLAELRTVWKS
jgi:hypothetical protein